MADPRHGTPDDKLLRLARQRFDQGQEATHNQREREMEDLRFYAGDQWPADIRTARAGMAANGGSPAVPARPCITINKTREPVKQVLNQERQSDMAAEIVAADDFGDLAAEVDETEIALREGLLRRIMRAPETRDAITWMFARGVQCGTGYLGVMTRYLKGQTFDQEPYVCRFYNQASVTIDPAHEQPDGSDAEWVFVGTDMPFEQYEAEFGKIEGKRNRVVDADAGEFRGLGDDAPGWFTDEGTTRMCRVVDYYYTVRETQTLALLPDGSVVLHADVPEGVTPVETRPEIVKTIKWAKLDGCQVLDRTDWPGPDLPIVKYVGEELQPYDEERRSEGMVRPAIESNRGENYMISKLVETIGLAPIPPLMMAAGQDEGFEAEYATMNTRTLGVLHYNFKDAEGNPIGPPTRPQVDTQIGPMVTAIQFFDEAIKSTTGVPDATLGNVDPSLKSGRALKLLQQQSQLGTSNFLDNLARSVRRLGVILNGLFYPLYHRPGRLARIVNGDGESETALINAPPETLPPPMPPMPGQPGQMPGQVPAPPPPPKVFTLTEDAHFNVNIKVVPNKETRRDAESSALGDLIGANPEFMGWFGDKFLRNLDIPDHKELAERAKVMLAPPIQAMLAEKAKGGPPVPPHIQQQLAKAQEVIQALTQQVEQMTKAAEMDAAKTQAAQQIAQMESAAKVQLEQIKADAATQKQQMADQFAAWLAQFEAQQATIAREDEQRHEMSMAAAEAAQATQAAARAQQHETEQNDGAPI